MDDLKARRVTLEKELKRKEDVHQTLLAGSMNEAAYQTSCQKITEVYTELADVCRELGDPIPLKF